MPHFDPNTVDNFQPSDYLPQMQPQSQPRPTPFDAWFPFNNPQQEADRHNKWNRQTLTLSIFGVGLTVLMGCLLVAYLPGDRATMARLQMELNHERDRANKLDVTVKEQNELIQAQSKRLGELNDALFDAHEDIKTVRETIDENFREYAPHE